MQVDVVNGLPPCPVAIHNHPIALFGDALLPGEFGGGQEQLSHQFGMLVLNVIDGPYRLLGNDQDVGWGLGVDVAKSEQFVRFQYDVGRDFAVDDLHKQIVGHGGFLGAWLALSMVQSLAEPQESGGYPDN